MLNKYESFNSEVFKTLMFKAQYDSVYNLIKHKPIYMGWYYTFLDSLEKAQALFKKAHYKEGEEYLKLLQRKIKPQYINSRIKVLYYVIKGEEDSIFLFISGLEDKLIDKDAYLEMLFFSLEPDEDLRIAYVMYAVGDIIGAEKLLSNIEKKNAKRLLGIILFKRKRYKKALELFDDTPVGLYYKYLIYTKLKDYKRADEIRNTLLLKYSNTVYAAFIR